MSQANATFDFGDLACSITKNNKFCKAIEIEGRTTFRSLGYCLSGMAIGAMLDANYGEFDYTLVVSDLKKSRYFSDRH